VEARVHRLYEAGVQETDAAIADALEDLRQTGFLDGAIVVVTSDHGEGFGEHGTRTHGWNLYPEVIEVPLIIQAPGRLPPGVRIEAQVRSVDVAPTVLALAGVEPPASFEGRSLVGPEGQLPEARVAVAAVGLTDRLKDRDYVAVVSADHLYVRDRKSGAVEFYDLTRDPGALHDLGPDHPLVPGYAALEGGGDATRLENVELDPALRAELRTLGYLVDDDDEGEGEAGSP